MASTIWQQYDLFVWGNNEWFDLHFPADCKLHVMVERVSSGKYFDSTSLKLKVIVRWGNPKLLVVASKFYQGA